MIDNLPRATALLFDMDGVLIDSEIAHKRAKEQAFRRFGIELSDSIYSSYVGRPDATMIDEILHQRNESHITINEILAIKNQLFLCELEGNIHPISGAIEFLRWAASRYRIALATSAAPAVRAASLTMFGVDANLFEVIVDSSQVTLPKPHPEVFLKAAAGLGVSARECWVIEDSLNGIRAAKSAGCVAVGLTTTFDAAHLSNGGADIVASDFSQIRTALGDCGQKRHE